jgi:toxin CcdB
MSQYTVYNNTNPSSNALYPFLMDVQSPLLDSLETRLVIPLSLKSRFSDKVIKNLTPILSINGLEYLVLTPQMAAISKKNIGILVEDFSASRNEILSSIDFLITGF